MKGYHELEILHRNIFLDGLRLKGVLSYQLENIGSEGLAHLKVTMSVPDFYLEVDKDRIPEKKKFTTSRHQFEKDNENFFLGSFELVGVNGYKINGAANDKSAELVLNITVLDSKVVFCNGRNGNRD